MPYSNVIPVVDPSVRELCAKRYHGHPKGCPNFGKRPSCPPAAPLIIDVLDFSKPIWCVWNAYDFGAHVAKMRERHPQWSDRQLANCLYWQGTARKQLKESITHLLAKLPPTATEVVRCPEACGVNVTETMKKLAVYLQWPPKTIAYQVALVGTPKE
jgi:hypothetical protein